MKNKKSNFEIEKQLFNNLLETVRNGNARTDSREANKLRTYLAENTQNFSSSLKLLQHLEKSRQVNNLPVTHTKTFKPLFNLNEITHVTEGSKEDFCIALFTFNSTKRSRRVLESLKRSGVMRDVEVFMDGPHAIPKLAKQVEKNRELIGKYRPKKINSRAGNYGFRRIMMESLLDLSSRYKRFLVLEDDCFPTRDAISIFRKELDNYETDQNVLTVYGSHFLCNGEFPLCPRFQGWGWATWSEKIIPFIHKLMRLYLLPEKEYLSFINSTFTDSMKNKIDDLTHPRSCSFTTKKFFAWDETLTHLSALENKYHRPTSKRCIYNFGMDENSSHFPLTHEEKFRKPPFNLITPEEVWKYFE